MITNRRTNIISENRINYNSKIKYRFDIKSILTKYVISNVKEIFSVISLLLIGIIIGTILVNNISQEQKTEVTTYIQDYISNIKDGKSINKKAVFLETIKNNLIFTIILWFAGLTIIGIPIVYITIIFKGFTLGYTISIITAILGIEKGSIFVFSTMFLQNILAIPCILALAVSGIKIYKVIIKDKRRENIKLELCRHTTVSIIFFNILIIEAFLSGYLSTSIIENMVNVL